ncbi:MAG: hypothetical protein CXZ00_09685 [Acidobacteria bacterium]|mgnify:CR=1 FL=1|nr:MAG: hypothetical protein CXZ00_09685 [Acidobacteriota bacterium]
MGRKPLKRKEDYEVTLDERDLHPRRAGPRSAGQCGDTQDLTDDTEAAPESVEELAENDQPYEAEVVKGVEDAGDHPERPVRSHQDPRPLNENELPPDPNWK